MVFRRDDPSHKQKVIYSLTEASIALVPLLAHMGGWGLHKLPIVKAGVEHGNVAKRAIPFEVGLQLASVHHGLRSSDANVLLHNALHMCLLYRAPYPRRPHRMRQAPATLMTPPRRSQRSGCPRSTSQSQPRDAAM